MVRLPRRIWLQLAILAAVTLIAGGVMAFGFVNVPALMGIGRYNVTLQLPASGGLYPTSVVTYRGSEIGRVTSIDVTPDGVRANLKLQSSTKIPSDVSAAVHSRSAVGEQFVELTPKEGDDTSRPLGDGDVIPVGSTQIRPISVACWTPPTERCRRSRTTISRPWSTKPTRRSRDSAGTVPHRRRIDVARERCSQEPGFDHPSHRPVTSGAQLPSADGGFDRRVGGSDVVGHRAAEGARHRLRRSAQYRRPRARRGHSTVRPGRSCPSCASGQSGQPR